MNRFAYFLPLAGLIILGAMLYLLLQQSVTMVQQQPSVTEDRALPEFSIQGLTHKDVQGGALLHVTASWCGMCKMEHPLLMQLAKKIPVYGVAWKDKPEALHAWLKKAGNPYKKMGFDDGKLGIELGITGTPESFLISKKGRIIAHFRGPLMEEQIETEILGRLK